MRGTQKAERPRGDLGSDAEGYTPKPPSWLNRRAKALFKEKVAMYQERGQRVQGFESALAHYCAHEAAIIEDHRKDVRVTASAMAQLQRYQTMFYDSPAAQVDGGSEPKPGNPFDGIGQ